MLFHHCAKAYVGLVIISFLCQQKKKPWQAFCLQSFLFSETKWLRGSLEQMHTTMARAFFFLYTYDLLSNDV